MISSASDNSRISIVVSAANILSTKLESNILFSSSVNESYFSFNALISSASSNEIFSISGNAIASIVVDKVNILLIIPWGNNANWFSVNASYLVFADLIAFTSSSETFSLISDTSFNKVIANVASLAINLSNIACGTNASWSSLKSLNDVLAASIAALSVAVIEANSGNPKITKLASLATNLSNTVCGTNAFCSGLKSSYASLAASTVVLFSNVNASNSGNNNISITASLATNLSNIACGTNVNWSGVNASYLALAASTAVLFSNVNASNSGNNIIAIIASLATNLSNTVCGTNAFCSGLKSSYASLAALIAVSSLAVIETVSVNNKISNIVSLATNLSNTACGTNVNWSGVNASYLALAASTASLSLIVIEAVSFNSKISNIAKEAKYLLTIFSGNNVCCCASVNSSYKPLATKILSLSSANVISFVSWISITAKVTAEAKILSINSSDRCIFSSGVKES